MTAATAALLADGRRLHLQHGPIDLIIKADGESAEINLAYAQAQARFASILEELVAELDLLRSPRPTGGLGLQGVVAKRMETAITPFEDTFVTPMAAVAGAVADEILAALTVGRKLSRAYVNNGGDIALYLSDDAGFDIGLVAIPERPELNASVRIDAISPVRGIATSGRHGRSLSLGIADAVTVLAATAAAADAAATLIANAVDLPGHPAIQRRPATGLDSDSDLSGRLVTVAVDTLTAVETDTALQRGLAAAEAMRSKKLLLSAALCLNGVIRLCGASSLLTSPLINPLLEEQLC